MPGSGQARVARSSISRNVEESSSLPLSQPTDENNEVIVTSGTNEIINSNDPSSRKRVRGPTRGLVLAKKLQRGDPIDIIVSDNRIVGSSSGDFVNEAGIVIRDHSPLHIRKWKSVPLEDKNKMWVILRDKFRMPNDDETKNAVLKQLSTHHRNYRSKLHVEYFKPHGSIEVALQHCPPLLTEDKWRMLCELFDTPNFKKVSGINSDNRSQQTILHCAGSKGYHRREYEKRNKETGEPLNMLELWEETHFNDKTKKWVNGAEAIYNEVKGKKEQADLEGVEMTYDEAFAEVLGHKSGYIRGRGTGPKPKQSAMSAIQKEKEAERERQLAAARKEVEEVRRDNELLKKKVDNLEAKVDSVMDLFLQQRSSF